MGVLLILLPIPYKTRGIGLFFDQFPDYVNPCARDAIAKKNNRFRLKYIPVFSFLSSDVRSRNGTLDKKAGFCF